MKKIVFSGIIMSCAFFGVACAQTQAVVVNQNSVYRFYQKGNNPQSFLEKCTKAGASATGCQEQPVQFNF